MSTNFSLSSATESDPRTGGGATPSVGTMESIDSFGALAAQISQQKGIRTLFLNLTVTEQHNRKLLKQLNKIFKLRVVKRDAKKNKFVKLMLNFPSTVESAPWVAAAVDLVWKGFKFKTLKFSWEPNAIELEAAIIAFSAKQASLGPDIQLPPLILEFGANTSGAMEQIFVLLCRFIENMDWPLKAVLFNMKDLQASDINGRLKDSLRNQDEKMEINFRNNKTSGSLTITKECTEALLDACSSKSYVCLDDIAVEFDNDVLQKFFIDPEIEKQLVLTQVGLNSLVELNRDWILEAVLEAEDSEAVANFVRGENQITVCLAESQVFTVLQQRSCTNVTFNENTLELGSVFELRSVRRSREIRLITDVEEEVLLIQEGITSIKTRAKFQHILSLLRNILNPGSFTHLKLLHFTLQEHLATEEVRLDWGDFKEKQEAAHEGLAVQIVHGDGVQDSWRVSQDDFAVIPILKKKLENAIYTGKVLSYSRPKLVALGPSGSGKTSTLLKILNLEQNLEVPPTIIADNKWDVKIKQADGEELHWDVSPVNEMNNGLSADLTDVFNSIDANNAPYVFVQAAALQSQKNLGNILGENARFPSRSRNRRGRGKTNRHQAELESLRLSPRPLNYSKLSVWDTSASDLVLTDYIMHDKCIYILTLSFQVFVETPNVFKEQAMSWVQYIDSSCRKSLVLIVVTNSGENPDEQILINIDTLMKDIWQKKKIQLKVIKNSQKNLMLFPLDNQSSTEDKFQILRDEISNSAKQMFTEIPVSWLYFMDLVFQTEKVFFTKAELEEKAAEYRLQISQIPQIIKKYCAMGAVFCVQQRNEFELFSDVVVLRPQKFIEALRSVLLAAEATEQQNGIITSEVLRDCLRVSFPNDEKARYRFSQFCGDSLIFSRWICPNGDNSSIYIPYRNIHDAPEIFQPPDPRMSWSIFLAWEVCPPESFFERVLILLLDINAGIGGAVTPKVFRDGAHFITRTFEFFVIKHSTEIEIRFLQAFHRYFTLLGDALELVCGEMRNRGFPPPSVVLESTLPKFLFARDNNSKIKAKMSVIRDGLIEAFLNQYDAATLPAFGLNRDIEMTTVVQYYQLFENPIEAEETPPKTDICILHDWGSFDEGQATFPHHDKVLKIVEHLRSNDSSVWVDDNEFQGFDARFGDAHIQASSIIVLILTTNFVRQLENQTSALYYQLTTAMAQGSQTVVPLIMEDGLNVRANWENSALGFHFCASGPVRFLDAHNLSDADIAALIQSERAKLLEIIQFMASYGPVPGSTLTAQQFPWLQQ